LLLSFGLVLASLLSSGARGEEARLLISGYDPVAYFTDGKPVQGKPDLEYLWHRLRWRFASVTHRAMFVKDPDRYTPQYDRYCAMGTSGGAAAQKETVDPEAWAIVDGKLYLTHTKYSLQVWREKATEYIKQAYRDWQAVKNLPEPEIVGPPCAASPPTTKTAARDGGHWIRRRRHLRAPRAGPDRARPWLFRFAGCSRQKQVHPVSREKARLPVRLYLSYILARPR
jgi:hypothetical protein